MTVDGGIRPDAPVEPRPLAELIERLRSRGQLVRVAGDEPRAARVPGPTIAGIAYDSRLAGPDSLFVAIPGGHSDGHDFVRTAESSGSAAAIVERIVEEVGIPQVVVRDARLALATTAAWWYGDPSRELGVIGITGTDGKTTTSFLAAAVLEAAGISTGLITTAAVKIGAERVANVEHVTTPQAPELQGMLRAMVRGGNEVAIVESTSHGLALHRVAEIEYDVAIFTNLSHEHLELHGTFEAYRAAKVGLFERLGRSPGDAAPGHGPKRPARIWPRTAIVNIDDPSAGFFLDAAKGAGARLITYGFAETSDVQAADIDEDRDGLSFMARTPRWRERVTLHLAGRFNVANALAAIALGEALELDPAVVRSGLAGLSGVPGRMERLVLGQPFGVIVDYAHSPAALEKVLDILAPLAGPGAGLIVVFGSAGERDVQKRPIMGRVAGERCRLVIVTDEDPRGEDPGAILEEIAVGAELAGKRRGDDLLCIADRTEAIAVAFSRARPGDIVLLAGKGHEQSIITAHGPVAWDERAEAIRALARLGYSSGGSD